MKNIVAQKIHPHPGLETLLFLKQQRNRIWITGIGKNKDHLHQRLRCLRIHSRSCSSEKICQVVEMVCLQHWLFRMPLLIFLLQFLGKSADWSLCLLRRN
nr:hypothetical protein Iba_chr04fCG4620 [Ipomoea batatas]